MSPVTEQQAADFQATVERGGIAIFPTDTLYGIACDPDDAAAAERIHELKGRPPKKPSAVMWFTLEQMFKALGDELDPPTRRLAEALLPGPWTLVVANPQRRFSVACAGTPQRLGLRVPTLDETLASLATVTTPVMQTSANPSGGADATSLQQIEPAIRAGVDLEIDGGQLPGTGSIVVDVSELSAGRWRLLRAADPTAEQRLRELTGSEQQPASNQQQSG